MGQEKGLAHRRIDGTLVFADISGFTALTERLASAGKAGAEEMAQLLNATFEQLLTTPMTTGPPWSSGVETLPCCSTADPTMPPGPAGLRG